MTTATVSVNGPMETAAPGRNLEELVGRVIDALFSVIAAQRERSVARTVHEVRRLRQAGDLDGALAAFAGLDLAHASPNEARWAYGEWVSVARRRFAGAGAAVYSPGTGRAAVLVPTDESGMLEVAAALGMRWRAGQRVSRRSLRALRPLSGGLS